MCVKEYAKNLRKILNDNPDLPVIFMADGNAYSGRYSIIDMGLEYTSCTPAAMKLGRFYNGELPSSEKFANKGIYTDINKFREDMSDYLEENWRENGYDFPPEHQEKYIKNINRAIDEDLRHYDQYWQDCIIIYLSN